MAAATPAAGRAWGRALVPLATCGPFDRRLVQELPGLKASVGASVAVGLLAVGGVVAQAVALAHLLASAMPGAGALERAPGGSSF